MFARYSNIKAGKFQATEAEKMSDTYSEEEFENLNDVAKVLGTIGISIQEGNDFRGIQEVFDELIAKWEDLNETQKNAIATALAGTRQREALYTALENSTRITDLMTISMNSLGTAEEKMAAYSDSVEASQKRVTAAFEEWVLKMNGSPVLKWFNDQLAFTIENIDALAISLGAIFTVSQWKQLVSLGASGLEKLGEKFMNLGSMNFFSQGGEKVNIAQGLKNYAEELNLKFATNSIDELNKKFISLGKGMDDTTLSIVKQGQAALMQASAGKKLLQMDEGKAWLAGKTYTQDEANLILDKLEYQVKEQNHQATQEEIALRKLLTTELDKETKQRLAKNAQAPSATSKIVSGIGSLVGAGLGLSAGQFWGNKIGGDAGSVYGGMLGTIGGGVVGSKAISSIGKIAGAAKAAGGLGALTKSVIAGGAGIGGPIAWAVGGAVLAGTAVWSWVKSAQEKAKQEAIKAATEAAAEIEEQYKSAISSTSDVQRYDELAKGVDTLGRNVSLTDEEYQEFLDTSNSLADVFPELVVRTDEFGNKLLGTNDKVGTITDSIKTLTLEMQKSYNSSLLNTDLFEDELSKAQDAQEEYNKTLEKQGRYSTSISKDTLYNYRKSRGEPTYLEKGNPEYYFEVGKAASANGSLLDTILQFESSDLEKEVAKKLFKEGIAYESIGNNVLAYSKDQEEEVSKIVNTIISDGQEASEGIVTSAKNALDEVKNSLNSLVSSQLQASLGEENWNALTEEQQEGITAIAENISLFDKNGERKSLETYRQELRDLANNLQEILLENPLLFDVVYAEDSSMTISEMEKARQDLFAALVSLFPENASVEDMNKILIPFGFEFDENTEIPSIEEWLAGEEGKEVAESSAEEQTKAYSEYLRKLVSDQKDFRKLLGDKGINIDVGSISVENAKYAYENFSEEVIKSIDSIEDFQKALLNYKFTDDDLSYLISEYERLNALSRDSTQETQFRQVTEYVKNYAQALGIVSDNIDEIIEKTKLVSDMSIIGTTSKSIDEIEEQFTDYKEIYDYFTGENFDGKNISSEIYQKLMNNEKLASFAISKDTNGLISYLEQLLVSEDTYLKSSIEGQIASSNELTNTLLKNNQEYVRSIKEAYDFDYDAFVNLNDAKEVILKAQSGDLAGAWQTSVEKIQASFNNGIITLDEYNEKLEALKNSFFELTGLKNIATLEEWKKGNKNTIANMSDEDILTSYSNYVNQVFSQISDTVVSEAMTKASQALIGITNLLDESGYGLTSQDQQGQIDTLEKAVEEYDKLYSLYGKLKDEDQPKEFKDAKKAVETYAKAIANLEGNFDDILPKIREYIDIMGNDETSLSDVQNTYQDFQDILDYLNSSDFDGETLSVDIAEKILNYDSLKNFVASGDFSGLQSALTSMLDGADDVLSEKFNDMLFMDQQLSDEILENNSTLVGNLATQYGIDLNAFSSLTIAKETIAFALNGDMISAWATMNSQLQSLYDSDQITFEEYMSKKTANLAAFKSMFGVETYDEYAAAHPYISPDKMQASYEAHVKWTQTEGTREALIAAQNTIKELQGTTISSGISSNSGGGSSSTMEDILNARKALINKEYEAMLVYDETTGKATHTKYFEKMKEVLNDQLEYYNSLLKTAQTESERLDTLQKIQNVQVELANLNDEELQDELNLAQTKEASLSAQIDIQNQLIEAADTEEERIQRQKELNDLIKQEYELRVSINDFQMSLLERQANRVNPDSPLYEDLINEQIKESQNNTDLALEQIDRVREKLVKQYMSEKNPDGSFKYNIDEVRELVENSEEMQALYQTYLDNIDKATELVLEYASARLDRIDARINELEQTKPKEWTSIEQIIEYSDKNLDLLRGKIPILQEALSHSAEMTNEQIQSYVDQLNDVYAAIKEAEIQKQQDIIDYHDNVYDALTWQIQEYIDQIEKQKQIVEDYYDDEIDKINKVNDAKERTIELEKLQDELLNNRKNKARVWREGIGWTYEEDRNKVKEAQQNLDDFMTQDKVNDLNNAKEQELADLDERIENWNKYLEAIQDAHDAYEDSTKEHLLFELLHVQTQEELYEKLHDDMQNYIFTYDQNLDAYKNSLGEYGDLNTEYTGIFNDFLDSYKEALRKFDELTQSFNDVVNSDDFLNGDRNTNDLPEIDNGIYDDALSEREAREKLAEYSKLYFEARNRGDWQGMKHWNDTANDLRREMGWYDEIFVASDAIEAFKNGRTLQAVNGKAPEGARPGDRIVTEGGTYLIIGKKADGTWESVKLDTTSSSSGGSRNPLDPIETSYKGYANGLEEGPVTTTGLAMLHGTPLRPEYVLNHDQAWNLLHNFSTLKIPEFNKTNTTNQTNYNISGDIILNDVKDPQDFWKKLMQATSNRFNVTKRGR